jgi:hypothetical protein
VVIGDQEAVDGGADHPVVPAADVEGQQPLRDPGPTSLRDAAAVAFEAEVVLRRSDRLYPLAQPGPARARRSLGLARPNPITVPSQVQISSNLVPESTI